MQQYSENREAGALDGFVPKIPRRRIDFLREADRPRDRQRETPIEERQLSVGYGVSVNGKIQSCETLVVAGVLDADVDQCHLLELAASGRYVGHINVEIAIIHGRFEGVLNVTERLTISSTGRIKGIVRFGAIEVEAGGEIDGEMYPLSVEPTVVGQAMPRG